jgi:5-methylcytosine-specific restriction endonuclease McrA
VTYFLPKRPRLRLGSQAYEDLHQQVLRRDGWRCQSCGRPTNLEVHHQVSRSRGGDDSEKNLITLCAACHRSAHRLDQDIPDGHVGVGYSGRD